MFEDWELVEKITTGYSGCDSCTAKRKDSGELFFMKVLSNGSRKIRERFRRETVIYETVKVDNIPKIIEHNTELYKDEQTSLYYVAKHISGLQLDRYIQRRKMDESHIISLFKGLLLILRALHNQDIVHRDIKPQNIIISEDGGLYLVDFGIAFWDEDDEHLTEKGDELGNRFLRLADFSANSLNKRSSISDLTMACGIASYMISGETPRNLVDAQDQFPHQTEKAAAAIKRLDYAIFWNLIFDKGFQLDMSRRWGTADEILSILNKMKKENNQQEEYKKILAEHGNSIDKAKLASLKSALENIYLPLRHKLHQFAKSNAPGFRTERSEWVYYPASQKRIGHFRLISISNDSRIIVEFSAEVTGSQVVGYLAVQKQEKREVMRVAFGQPLTDAEEMVMDEQISDYLLPFLIGAL